MRYKNRCVMFRGFLLSWILVLLGGLAAEAQCSVEQTAKLLPDDGAAGDSFGRSVAISGSTAIIGSPEDDDNGTDSGSAYLFDTTTGGPIGKLMADDGAQGDWFGWKVEINGTTAIIGAFLDDDHGENSGSAYLFDTTTGNKIAKLVPDDGAEFDWFGYSVGISGTTAIVEAPRDDDNGSSSGSAYLFEATTGQQIVKLLPDDGAADGSFGVRVAISGSTAIVGGDGDFNIAGSAYLFDTTTGQQIAKLLPDDGAANDSFGGSVGIGGTTAIVGAYGDDDNGEDSGSAYLFDTTTGMQIAKLLPDDGAAGDSFARWVRISGATAIVGALDDDDNGENSGSAYLFDTTTTLQIAKLLPDDGAAGDRFGGFVGISGTTAIVASPEDDDNGEGSGSAYLFDVSNCTGVAIVPDSLFVFRGFQISGDLSDSFESDDSYMKFNPGLTLNSSEAPVWLIFEGTLPNDSPASLEIAMESNAGTPGLTHTLEAWNWTLMDYDVFDVSMASFNNDIVVTIDLSSGISDYAQSGTGVVRTRVGWRKTGLIINSPWEVRLDQMVWIVQ